MKRTTIIYLVITAIVVTSMMVVGCSVGAGSGHLQVITPDASEISRGVYNTDDSFIRDASEDGRLRFEVGVEVFGQRIMSAQLKPGDDKLLTVPAGVPLTIGVGIYLAQSATEEREEINAYLVSDVKNNLVLVPGETRYLDYVLDTSQPTVVDSYFKPYVANAPGLASIISGVLNVEDNSPYFSVFDFDAEAIKTLKFVHTAPQHFEPQSNADLGGISAPLLPGLLFKAPVPDAFTYWHLSSAGILRSQFLGSSGDFSAAPALTVQPEALAKLTSVRKLDYVKYENGADKRYLYFFSYGTGYVSVRYDVDVGGGWSHVEAIEFGDYFDVMPNETFVLDVEQDTSSDLLTHDNSNMVFFATKLGLFYTPEHVLHDLKAGLPEIERRNNLLIRSSMIRIPNPKNTDKTLIVTSVKATKNRIFLGTRAGVFMIHKSNNAWKKFSELASQGVTSVLEPGSMASMPAFPSEPVISNELYDLSDGSNLLVLATHRKVIFTRFQDSGNYNPQVRTITVWDGIPFIPKVKLPDFPGLQLNNVDFLSHDVSRLSFVLFDESQGVGNELFWIGTLHGLGSIPLDRIF